MLRSIHKRRLRTLVLYDQIHKALELWILIKLWFLIAGFVSSVMHWQVQRKSGGNSYNMYAPLDFT